MCGIAGLVHPDPSLAQSAIQKMVQCQNHRGPDDRGNALLPFGDGHLALGHNRLSIIDLSAAGHQPMVHPHTADQLIFNGEIYNFADLRKQLEAQGEQFKGHSDTEVLLHGLSRFGPDFVPRLAGMYAFAFYNAREQSLLLARDPAGMKPLYVARLEGSSSGALIFASEVRAILATGLVPAQLDLRAVAGCLAYGAVQQPLTIVKNIRAFPPGSSQLLQPHGNGAASAPKKFWTFPRPKFVTESDAVEKTKTLLDQSVRDHLVADVPVGVFLSSGLDSTIMAGLAARHSPQMRTFTVGFDDQPDLSEQALASQTAQLFGLRHENINITNADAEAAARQWLDAIDQPSMDGLNTFIISQAVRRAGITVAISGQGGDELFGGYPSFRDVPRFARLLKNSSWLPAVARASLGKLAKLGKSAAVKDKITGLLTSNGSLLQLYLQRRRMLSDPSMAALGLHARGLELDVGFMPPDAIQDAPLDAADPVWTVSALESTFYQGNTLLRDSDNNGMAHSLEIRMPLLDQRVLDFVHTIPGSVRVPNGQNNKHLLRRAFSDFLRPVLADQKKRGFHLPFKRWMQGPLRSLCEQSLAHLKSHTPLDPKGIDATWQTFLNDPESSNWSRPLTLVVLGHYLHRLNLTV